METKERLARLRAEMEAAGAAGCLIPSSDPHASEYLPDHWAARRYFSGFTGSVGTLAVTMNGAALWVDGRYFVQAEHQLEGSGIELQRMGLPGVPTVEEYLCRALCKGDVLAVDGAVTPTAQVRRLQKALEKQGVQVQDIDLPGRCWPDRPPMPATPCFVLGRELAGLTASEKLAKLREALDKEKADGMLLGRLDSVAWLLNLRAYDLDCTPFALAWCWVDRGRAVVFLDSSRADETVRGYLAENGVELQEYDQVEEFLAHVQAPLVLRAEPESLNWRFWRLLEVNSAVTVQEGADPVQELKAVKNETEIACIRASHKKDGVAMVRFERELERRRAAGETLYESDVENILIECRRKGEGYLEESFSAIAACGANAAMMHYHAEPGACSPLANHGFLLVDCGGQYMDGTTDITRTYALGELTDAEKRMYTLVLKGHIDLAMLVFPMGSTGGNLDLAARRPLWAEGLDYRCGTGHGVGFVGGVHETPPRLNQADHKAITPGMVVTDEPGYYETDVMGIRIENELICVSRMRTEYGEFCGFEPLTRCPIGREAIRPDMLTREELAWLNAYHQTVLEDLSPLLDEEERAWLADRCRPIEG